jgi:hypothetical protein
LQIRVVTMAAVIWAALALAAAAVVFALLQRAQEKRAARRAEYLADVAGLFNDARLQVQPTGFPRLSGWHDGALCDLQVVPDTLSLRKLPALWVLVSLPGPLPVTGATDLMLRPTGMETFTNFARLPVQVQLPEGFPADCAIRAEGWGAVALADALRWVLAAVEVDRLKEVLITPKGVRLVFLAEEADRGRYLLFRDAEMGRVPLTKWQVAPFLAAARGLRDAVLDEGKPRRQV